MLSYRASSQDVFTRAMGLRRHFPGGVAFGTIHCKAIPPQWPYPTTCYMLGSLFHSGSWLAAFDASLNVVLVPGGYCIARPAEAPSP